MKPALSMPKLTALERLRQGVEEQCNSDEGLLYLAKALLAHKPKSDTEMRYIRALVEYIFTKRRWEIFNKRGAQFGHAGVYDPHYSYERDMHAAHAERDRIGALLAQEEGPEAVPELKKRIGAQMAFAGAFRTSSRFRVT